MWIYIYIYMFTYLFYLYTLTRVRGEIAKKDQRCASHARRSLTPVRGMPIGFFRSIWPDKKSRRSYQWTIWRSNRIRVCEWSLEKSTSCAAIFVWQTLSVTIRKSYLPSFYFSTEMCFTLFDPCFFNDLSFSTNVAIAGKSMMSKKELLRTRNFVVLFCLSFNTHDQVKRFLRVIVYKRLI